MNNTCTNIYFLRGNECWRFLRHFEFHCSYRASRCHFTNFDQSNINSPSLSFSLSLSPSLPLFISLSLSFYLPLSLFLCPFLSLSLSLSLSLLPSLSFSPPALAIKAYVQLLPLKLPLAHSKLQDAGRKA